MDINLLASGMCVLPRVNGACRMRNRHHQALYDLGKTGCNSPFISTPHHKISVYACLPAASDLESCFCEIHSISVLSPHPFPVLHCSNPPKEQLRSLHLHKPFSVSLFLSLSLSVCLPLSHGHIHIHVYIHTLQFTHIHAHICAHRHMHITYRSCAFG